MRAQARAGTTALQQLTQRTSPCDPFLKQYEPSPSRASRSATWAVVADAAGRCTHASHAAGPETYLAGGCRWHARNM